MNNILVTRSSMPSFEEYCEEIKDIWDSHWLTNMGVKHKELQKELENYLGIPHVALYTNGHLALENAIAALNLPKGGEVITTPFTFASTTHAIVRNGLVPVFCDIKEDDYTIDTQKLENLITDNTVAIVPVHVYGNMCDVEEIDRIAANCEFNGLNMMDGSMKNNIALQVGLYGDASSQIELDASLFKAGDVNSLFGEDIDEVAKKCSGYDGTTITGNQSDMLDKIDEVINEISSRTTTLGSAQNRIESAIESISVQSENITSSLSTLRDADVAEESSNYIKAQILQQASATLLATANQTPSIALNLL